MIRQFSVVAVMSALFFSCNAASPQYARLTEDQERIDALLEACDSSDALFKETLSRSFVAVSRKHMLTVLLYKMSFHPNAKALWKIFNTYYASCKTPLLERTFNNALANHLAAERHDRFIADDGVLSLHVYSNVPSKFKSCLAVGDTLMHSLARAGLVNVMQLVMKHANQKRLRETCDSCGRTIIFSLHYSLIAWAVAAGWDVNARDLAHNTPMIYFLKTIKDAENRYKYVDVLADLNASFSAENYLRNSPISLIASDACNVPAWFRRKHEIVGSPLVFA
jgi:hypothetical protein